MSSYQALPIGGGLEPLAARRAALVVVVASAKLIASGLALAAPVVVALWLTDLALGPDRARRAVGAGVFPGPPAQRVCWRSAWFCWVWECYRGRWRAVLPGG